MARWLKLFALLAGLLPGLSSAHAQRHLKWAVKGDSLLSGGRMEEALAAYERSFKARENSRAAFGIGECVRGLGSGGDSLWYRRAVGLAKKEYVVARMADKPALIYMVAYSHQRLGEHEEVIRWFSKDNCKGREVYLEIGRSEMALGNYTDALQAFRKYDHYFPGRATDLIEECERAMGR